MKNIDKLLHESVYTQSNQVARPTLLGLTRATTQLIYTGLVSTQRTSHPVSVLYGVKYLNPDNNLSALTGALYTGETNKAKRDALKKYPDVTSFAKDEQFTDGKFVYKALDNVNLTAPGAILEQLTKNKIRLVAQGAQTSHFEHTDEISTSGLRIDKWEAPVKSRKLKTEVSVELAQDLEAAGFDAPNVVEDLLATQIAEEINKEITQSLITVSRRYSVQDKQILDLSQEKESNHIGKKLYQYVCEMNGDLEANTSFGGDWVVGSARAIGILASSGYLRSDSTLPANVEGRLPNGLIVYTDPNAPFDYVIVGIKRTYGELEGISSLVYSPYTEGLDLDSDEHVGQFKVIVDSDSLQPTVGLLVRYSLSVNPYTCKDGAQNDRIHDGTDFDNLTGKSLMSVMLGIKLPELT